jgi:hypothetical protein
VVRRRKHLQRVDPLVQEGSQQELTSKQCNLTLARRFPLSRQYRCALRAVCLRAFHVELFPIV